MGTPTASYDPRYPQDKDPRNTQFERRAADNLFIKQAADYNRHDEILQAIECYLGFTTGFDPSGPVPGPGDTITRILERIVGSGDHCIEDGYWCDYENVDPSGFVTAATGDMLEWIEPTGIPCYPPEPPLPPLDPNVPWSPDVWAGDPPQPGVPGVPGAGNNPNPNPNGPFGAPWGAPCFPFFWPGPKGGGNNPLAPINPLGQPGGDPPGGSTFPNSYGLGSWAAWITWLAGTNKLRHQWNSAATINLQPYGYDDLRTPWKTIVDLNAGFPPGYNPSTRIPGGQVSIFDMIYGMLVPISMMQQQEGFETASFVTSGGATDTFTAGNGMNGGWDPSGIAPFVLVDANNVVINADVDRFEDGSGDIAGRMSTAGPVTITIHWLAPPSAGRNVQIQYLPGAPSPELDYGKPTSFASEIVAIAGGTGTLSNEPKDFKGGVSGIFTAMCRVVGGTGVWTPCDVVSGAVGDANEVSVTAPTTLNTHAPSGYTEAWVSYLCAL